MLLKGVSPFSLQLVAKELFPLFKSPSTRNRVLNDSVPKNSGRDMDTCLTTQLDMVLQFIGDLVAVVGCLCGCRDGCDLEEGEDLVV